MRSTNNPTMRFIGKSHLLGIEGAILAETAANPALRPPVPPGVRVDACG